MDRDFKYYFNTMKLDKNLFEFKKITSKYYEDKAINSSEWKLVTRSIAPIVSNLTIIYFQMNNKYPEYVSFNNKDLYSTEILIDFSKGNIVYDSDLMNEDLVILGIRDFIQWVSEDKHK